MIIKKRRDNLKKEKERGANHQTLMKTTFLFAEGRHFLSSSFTSSSSSSSSSPSSSSSGVFHSPTGCNAEFQRFTNGLGNATDRSRCLFSYLLLLVLLCLGLLVQFGCWFEWQVEIRLSLVFHFWQLKQKKMEPNRLNWSRSTSSVFASNPSSTDEKKN